MLNSVSNHSDSGTTLIEMAALLASLALGFFVAALAGKRYGLLGIFFGFAIGWVIMRLVFIASHWLVDRVWRRKKDE